MADDWVDLKHEETGGTTRVPNLPDVLTLHESRGWVRVDEEGPEPPEPYVAPDGVVPEWVELTHPALPTGSQRVPNHPDAIAGQLALGWQLPEPPAADSDAAEAEPEPKRRKPKETPAADAGTDNPAGDGTDEKE